jgi:hypothetical protein
MEHWVSANLVGGDGIDVHAGIRALRVSEVSSRRSLCGLGYRSFWDFLRRGQV